jgi:hypothetical protein
MKKLLTVLLFIAIALTASAQSLSSISPGFPLNAGAGTTPGIAKFGACATPTLTMSATPQLIGTLPAGTVAVMLSAKTSPIAYGNASVTSTTDTVWPVIASGSTVVLSIYPGETQPKIYFCPYATGTTGVLSILPILQTK